MTNHPTWISVISGTTLPRTISTDEQADRSRDPQYESQTRATGALLDVFFELRRRRLALGLSLADLAGRTGSALRKPFSNTNRWSTLDTDAAQGCVRDVAHAYWPVTRIGAGS